MMHFGYFEAEMQQRYAGEQLVIRNMCDEGNTPGFRPHSARPSPWAFPGADQFHPPLSKARIVGVRGKRVREIMIRPTDGCSV